MIVVRIEMWPHGDERLKREIGAAMITNQGTGTRDAGNYTVRLMKSAEYARSPGVWKRGEVEGFPRLRLGPWDLLYRALHATVASRNRVAGRRPALTDEGLVTVAAQNPRPGDDEAEAIA